MTTEETGEFPDHHPAWTDTRWRSRVRRRLLDWFSVHARELPWRSDPTPYKVWVSEIMLQQTQVATVIPYFQRFLEAFPDVESLASADEQRLLALWEGLGYYRRARSLHAAAKIIVAEHRGIFPDNYDDVLKLPGIGRYTAGAILSISRNQRLPVLEGNTQRVFSRWAAVRAIPGEAPTTRLLWKIASAMLPRDGAGTFNQAAMELGALVCLARNPQCDDCPVRGYCRARLEGRQNEIPGKVTRINYQSRTEFALVVREPKQPSDRYLLRPLPEGGRWAGLWDFPRTTNESFDSVGAAADSLAQETGLAFSPGMRLKTIKHAVTKYRIVLHVHQADLAPQAATKPPWRFVSLHEMADLPMSVTGREIAELLSSDRQQPLPLGTRHNV